jgi:hypothetical protein
MAEAKKVKFGLNRVKYFETPVHRELNLVKHAAIKAAEDAKPQPAIDLAPFAYLINQVNRKPPTPVEKEMPRRQLNLVKHTAIKAAEEAKRKV